MARVPLLTQSDLPEEHQNLFEVDEEASSDVIVNIHRAMVNNPRVLNAWGEWILTLFDEVGNARIRELVILAVAKATDSQYIWHQHVPIALEENLSRSKILAISNNIYDELTSAETAVLEYVTEVANGFPDDDQHETLSCYYDDSEIIALVFLAAEYISVSRVITSLAIEIEDEFIGWQLQQHG